MRKQLCLTAMVFVIVTVAAPRARRARAQELANTFDRLRVLVKPGDTVRVTDGAGLETKGTIAALSSTSLDLVVANQRRSFLESDVRTIRQRRSDSLKNGALWGFGIGAGLALIGVLSDDNCFDCGGGFVTAVTLLNGGLGAAVGVGIDAMIRHTEAIYSRPAGSTARGPHGTITVRLRLNL